MKKEANYPKIGRLTMYNCTQYNRQREEPKVSPDRTLVTQPSVVTSSALKLIVEVNVFVEDMMHVNIISHGGGSYQPRETHIQNRAPGLIFHAA